MTHRTARRTMESLSAFLLPALALVANVSAQATTPEGAVTANGTATVERNPDVMRMETDVTAQGKDAKEALAGLKAQEKSIRGKLAALGAADAAVKFGEAHVQVENVNQQQMMARMLRARSGGHAKAPTTGPAAQPVSIAMSLTVEWPLKGTSGEELLVEAHDLQQKIKAADVVAPPKSALTPEQQEELEEQMGMSGGEGEGGLLFTFVAKLSPEERAKATAEAFARAKKEAARVAAAAGAELGALRQLTSSAGSATDAEQMNMMNMYGLNSRRALYARAQQQEAGDDAAANEAVGTQPGKVKYQVTLVASFALK